jgi:hypothetical protein
VFAPVAGEVALVAVDHGQAGAHVARELEGGDAGTQGEGREGVTKIVDAAERLDPGGYLGWFPVAVADVVEVEVAAAGRRKEKLQTRTLRCLRWRTLRYFAQRTGSTFLNRLD